MPIDNKIDCLKNNWISFQLVDEYGDGKPYAGLVIFLMTQQGSLYGHTLDHEGYLKLDNKDILPGHLDISDAMDFLLPCGGAVILYLDDEYDGSDPWYQKLQQRKDPSLPKLTALQVAAEQTTFRNIKNNEDIKKNSKKFNQQEYHYNIEVRDLVKNNKHLPLFRYYEKTLNPLDSTTSTIEDNNSSLKGKKQQQDSIDMGYRFPDEFKKVTIQNPSDTITQEIKIANKVRSLIKSRNEDLIYPKDYGIGLYTGKHHTIQIRALRAYRPLLSLSKNFSALNLYQCSILAALAYSNFDQELLYPTKDNDYKFTTNIKYPTTGSIGNTLAIQWPHHNQNYYYGKATSKQQYSLIMEDVPYSKRFEIIPFDPEDDQYNTPSPQAVHFMNITSIKGIVDVQGFITHSDQIILISIRGTQGIQDFITDAYADQTNLSSGARVHKGFYNSFKLIKKHIESYLNRFRNNNQHIIVTGHSLGGAIATITAEWIRKYKTKDVLLYTYGSPRVGDTEYVSIAKDLTHHRTISLNDPIPSLPLTSMKFKEGAVLRTLSETIFSSIPSYYAGSLVSVPLGITNALRGMFTTLDKKILAESKNNDNKEYAHHGIFHHFMLIPTDSPSGALDSILWEPSDKEGRNLDTPSALLEFNGIVQFGLEAAKNMESHYMFESYIPFSLAHLKRSKESMQHQQQLITQEEEKVMKSIFTQYSNKLELFLYKNQDQIDYKKFDLIKFKYESQTVNLEINDLQEIRKNLQLEMAKANSTLLQIKTLRETIINSQKFWGDDIVKNFKKDQLTETLNNWEQSLTKNK